MTVTSPCNVHESINVLKYYENWSRESQIGTMENNYAPWESHEQMSYMYMYHWFSRTSWTKSWTNVIHVPLIVLLQYNNIGKQLLCLALRLTEKFPPLNANWIDSLVMV